MADKLQLDVILAAIDQATGPLKRVMEGSKGLTKALKDTRDQLKSLNNLQGQMDLFKKLGKDAAITENQLKAVREQIKTLDAAMQAGGSKAMARDLAKLRKEEAGLLDKTRELALQLGGTVDRLNAAGVNTANLARHEYALQAGVQLATNKLKEQEAALGKVNARLKASIAAHAQYQRAMAMRGQLAGAGASMGAAGAATGAAVLRPVIDFAQAEDSATQLKAAMMAAGGAVRPEFEQINALAERLGNRLPGTTAELQDMMTMLQRQGMSAKAVLGGVGEASAYLGVQLKMPYTEAAEFAAKLQDATKTTEKDMLGLMDTIQKAYYLGTDSGNMLQGFAKLSPALAILKKEGLDAANMLAPLLVIADQAGLAGEAAGNAYRKIFQGALDADGKISKANKGAGLKLDFTNGKGEFGGMDKLFNQLAKLKALNTQERTGWIKTAFGDDAETLQALNLMIDKGKSGYDEVVAKMAAQASLQDRVNMQLGTLKNLWDAATGTFTNALVAFGEAVAPEVKGLVEWIGQASEKLRAWAKENPAMANGLMKLGGGLALVLAVLSGLSLALAAMLGPFAILRLSIVLMGLQVGRLGAVFGLLRGLFGGVGGMVAGFGRAIFAMGPMIKTALSGIGSALMMLGRLAMANPLIAFISVLAMGALYVWRNWGTLGPKFAALWASIKASSAGVWESIRSTMVGAWNGIIGYLSGLAGRFQSIGAQIIDGLRAGIESRIEAVRARVAALASSIAAAARGALGIQSPSRVFHEIGGHTMAGLAAGLSANRAPLETMRGITRQLAGVGAGLALAIPAAHAAPTARPLPAFDTRQPIAAQRLAGVGAGGGAMSVSITVNAAPGMDEQALARLVAAEVERVQQRQARRQTARLSDLD